MLTAEIHWAVKSGLLKAAVLIFYVWLCNVNSPIWVNKGKMGATKSLSTESFAVALAFSLRQSYKQEIEIKERRFPR